MSDQTTIAEISVDEELRVRWQNGESTSFSFLWLRDNARDEASFDSRSNQRRVFTANIDPEIRPETARHSSDAVVIKWPDADVEVDYTASFLHAFREPSSDVRTIRTWDAAHEISKIDFADVQNANSLLLEALNLYGIAVVQDCPTDESSVETIANYLGYIRQTIYGGIWSFENNAAMDDSAYSAEALRPHTDGTYSLDPPGVQILLCLEKDGDGGESIMVDGFHVAAEVQANHPEVFADLCQIPIAGVYEGDGEVLRAEHPVFRVRDGQTYQVCFNNYDRGVMRLSDDEMQRMYAGIRVVDQHFNDPGNQWRYTLSAGEAIVFDNWRILHGRTAYTGRRKMTGTYVNREDLVSRYITRLDHG